MRLAKSHTHHINVPVLLVSQLCRIAHTYINTSCSAAESAEVEQPHAVHRHGTLIEGLPHSRAPCVSAPRTTPSSPIRSPRPGACLVPCTPTPLHTTPDPAPCTRHTSVLDDLMLQPGHPWPPAVCLILGAAAITVSRAPGSQPSAPCAASLPSMTGILNKRPTSFASPKAAITWVTENNLSRSTRAATISVPSQLTEAPPGTGAAEAQWVWRTPLLSSEPYWEGWYSGLSDAFVAVRMPKVLLIAGADRLDRPLTIAQMQGKFQMVLVPQSGHAIQEDEPEEVAQSVQAFIQRFRIGLPPLEIPRATPGLPPVLPQAAGPLFDVRPKPM